MLPLHESGSELRGSVPDVDNHLEDPKIASKTGTNSLRRRGSPRSIALINPSGTSTLPSACFS